MNKKKYLLVLFFLGLLTQAQSPLPTVELQTLNGQLISTDEIASNNQLMII